MLSGAGPKSRTKPRDLSPGFAVTDPEGRD